MLLHQIRKLRDLTAQYGHDVAVARQQGHEQNLKDDLERLKALMVYDFDRKITEAVNEYTAMFDDDVSLLAAVGVLAGAIGAIIGSASRTKPDFVTKARKVTRSIEAKQFVTYSKDET